MSCLLSATKDLCHGSGCPESQVQNSTSQQQRSLQTSAIVGGHASRNMQMTQQLPLDATRNIPAVRFAILKPG